MLTSLVVRPFDGKFDTYLAQREIDYIGTTATINTGSVSSRFGEARVIGRSGVPLIMQVRCDQENHLQKGDEVLIILHDKERNAFVVEPLGTPVAVAVQSKLKKFHESRRKKIRKMQGKKTLR